MSNSNNKESSKSGAIVPRVRPLFQVPIFSKFDRPKIDKIPSPKCQTILYQSAMEHLWGLEHFASFAVISETLRNSSFGAHLLMYFAVDRCNVELFSHIITPTSCLSLQFIQSLTINAYGCDDAVQAFAERMVNTKYLHLQLQSMTLVNFDSVLCLICIPSTAEEDKKWSQLRSLRLANNDAVNDAVLATITSTRFPSLTLLDLDACCNITDGGLQHLSSLSSSVTSLSLSRCTRITDSGLAHIVSGLTSLKFLNLSCTLVTDAGIEEVTNNLTELTSLDLFACRQITDLALQHVESKLPTLKTLNLCGTLVTEGDITAKFREKLPNCQLLT